MKVGLDDYWTLKTLYENLFIELLAKLELEMPTVETTAADSLWLETLLLHRFKELGLMQTILGRQTNQEFKNVLRKAVETYQRYGLSSSFGALSFITTFCGEKINILKRDGNDFTNPGYKR